MSSGNTIPLVRIKPSLNILEIESGVWTPRYVPTSNAFTSITYSVQAGFYQRIDKLVVVTFSLETATLSKGSAGGSVEISGLPFASRSGVKGSGTVSDAGGWNDDPLQCTVEGSSTFIELMKRSASNAFATQVLVSDMLTAANTNTISGTASYFIE